MKRMLVFQKDTVDRICSHAQSKYPEECCGILLGRRQGGQRIACGAIQTENMMGEGKKAAHFMINPMEIVKAELSAERKKLEIIGFYHSHPDYEAVASKEDTLHMIEGYSYPIISVKNGICVGLKSFEKIKQTDTVAKEENILAKEK